VLLIKEIIREVKIIKDDTQDDKEEERYQKFKIYVDKQGNNVEKLKKLQKRYPAMFERIVKEKLGE